MSNDLVRIPETISGATIYSQRTRLDSESANFNCFEPFIQALEKTEGLRDVIIAAATTALFFYSDRYKTSEPDRRLSSIIHHWAESHHEYSQTHYYGITPSAGATMRTYSMRCVALSHGDTKPYISSEKTFFNGQKLKINRLNNYSLRSPLNVIIEFDEDYFLARSFEFPLHAFGESSIEALNNLKTDIENVYEELSEETNLSNEWLMFRDQLKKRLVRDGL